MLSRWDMQSHPPDILITNYSMLNIMLMRSQEENIIAKTRQWIESDPSHIFTLVIDELHMYRGTQRHGSGLSHPQTYTVKVDEGESDSLYCQYLIERK